MDVLPQLRPAHEQFLETFLALAREARVTALPGSTTFKTPQQQQQQVLPSLLAEEQVTSLEETLSQWVRLLALSPVSERCVTSAERASPSCSADDEEDAESRSDSAVVIDFGSEGMDVGGAKELYKKKKDKAQGSAADSSSSGLGGFFNGVPAAQLLELPHTALTPTPWRQQRVEQQLARSEGGSSTVSTTASVLQNAYQGNFHTTFLPLLLPNMVPRTLHTALSKLASTSRLYCAWAAIYGIACRRWDGSGEAVLEGNQHEEQKEGGEGYHAEGARAAGAVLSIETFTHQWLNHIKEVVTTPGTHSVSLAAHTRAVLNMTPMRHPPSCSGTSDSKGKELNTGEESQKKSHEKADESVLINEREAHQEEMMGSLQRQLEILAEVFFSEVCLVATRDQALSFATNEVPVGVLTRTLRYILLCAEEEVAAVRSGTTAGPAVATVEDAMTSLVYPARLCVATLAAVALQYPMTSTASATQSSSAPMGVGSSGTAGRRGGGDRALYVHQRKAARQQQQQRTPSHHRRRRRNSDDEDELDNFFRDDSDDSDFYEEGEEDEDDDQCGSAGELRSLRNWMENHVQRFATPLASGVLTVYHRPGTRSAAATAAVTRSTSNSTEEEEEGTRSEVTAVAEYYVRSGELQWHLLGDSHRHRNLLSLLNDGA